MQLYVHVLARAMHACMYMFVCRDYVNTHTPRYLEVRGTQNCEFGLWIAREWPRDSRHMLTDEFFRAVVTSDDVGDSSTWFWVGNSIFGTILHNRPSLSSLKYRTWSYWAVHSVPSILRSASVVLRVHQELCVLKAKNIPFPLLLLIISFYRFYASYLERMFFLHQWL